MPYQLGQFSSRSLGFSTSRAVSPGSQEGPGSEPPRSRLSRASEWGQRSWQLETAGKDTTWPRGHEGNAGLIRKIMA